MFKQEDRFTCWFDGTYLAANHSMFVYVHVLLGYIVRNCLFKLLEPIQTFLFCFQPSCNPP